MNQYFQITGFVGLSIGVIFTIGAFFSLIDARGTPREEVGLLGMAFFGPLLLIVFAPLTLAVALLYVVIAVVKNDWTWYER